MANASGLLRQLVGCTLLIVLATVSFLFSPAPKTEDEYCGTYLHLTSFAGFTANCDGFVYMEDAKHPGHLLEPKEVRQSRPLFILLGTAVGYPCTWLAEAMMAAGILPQQLVQHLPAKYQPLLGFYVGYVLLNYLVLLASMLLFIHLYRRLTDGHGNKVILGGLLVFFVSNQVTKAFFWTVHQQMFTFLVPLFCLYLVLELQEERSWKLLAAWTVLTGILALVYGSFVLCFPCMLYGLWQKRRNRPVGSLLAWCLVLMLLFALPTLSWIGLLWTQGVTYYNHEAEAYGQLIWLPAALREPLPEFLRAVSIRLQRFLDTLPGIGLFIVSSVAASGLMLRYHRSFAKEPVPGVLGLVLLFTGFFALLGYYRERLTFTLVPLLLCFIVVALHQLPKHRSVPWLMLVGALGWHVWQVLSYGPFS